MMNTYLNPIRGAKENWSRTLFALWLLLTSWLFIGPILTLVLDEVIPQSDQPARELFINLSGFIPLFVAGLSVPRIYGRSMMSAISLDTRFSYKTFALGAAAWAAIMGLTTGISFALSPDFYVWTFKAELFIPAVLVGLVLLPIQTGAEELLFRSYIPQVFSRVISSKLAITAISSIMFALPHLPNPEAQEKPIAALVAYTAIGWAFTAGAISVGRLEISMGAHFINNFFSLFIVGYANSALPSAALWTTPAGDMNATAVSTVVFTAVWLGVLRLMKKFAVIKS
jgi:membrane protease YdiL (CAAX protease family)